MATTAKGNWFKTQTERFLSKIESSKVERRQDYHKCRFTTVNGLYLNADNELFKKLKSKGHTQGESSDPRDYILAFCPISTRPGINIQETMEMCKGEEHFKLQSNMSFSM